MNDLPRLRDYEVTSRIGRGGMADVYLARPWFSHEASDVCVVKRLRGEDGRFDPEGAARMLDEGRLARRLSHPNIVRVHDVVTDDGAPYIVMEFLEGQSLASVRKRLKASDPVHVALGIHVLCNVLAALHHAHELDEASGELVGLVHRDVSPDNILVTYSGDVRLLDFGIAKSRGQSVRTKTGVFVGKARYAAPEQLIGATLDRRAHIYAVGATLWEVLSGQRLWGKAPVTSVYSAALSGRVPSLRDAAPHVNAEFAAVCERAMQRDPCDRYQTAAEMASALADAARASGVIVGRATLASFLATRFAEERAEAQCLVPGRDGDTPAESAETALDRAEATLEAEASGLLVMPEDVVTVEMLSPVVAARTIEDRPRPLEAATNPPPEPSAATRGMSTKASQRKSSRYEHARKFRRPRGALASFAAAALVTAVVGFASRAPERILGVAAGAEATPRVIAATAAAPPAPRHRVVGASSEESRVPERAPAGEPPAAVTRGAEQRPTVSKHRLASAPARTLVNATRPAETSSAKPVVHEPAVESEGPTLFIDSANPFAP